MIHVSAKRRAALVCIFRVAHMIAYRIWVALLAARVALLVAALAVLALDAFISHAHAAPISQETLKNTYMFGQKCYVANAVSATDARFNADGAHSADFKGKGQKSYETIWAMGRAIGKSDPLIQEDIDSYQKLFQDAYLRDDALFLRTRYECGRVGLM